MFHTYHKFFFYFSFICLLFVFCQKSSTSQFFAQRGTLELSNWDFEKDGNIRLDGEWEFHWKKSFDDIKSENSHSVYTKVPGKWTSINKYPITGYATYLLKIKNVTPGLYSLNTEMLRSFHLTINGTPFSTKRIHDPSEIELPSPPSRYIYPFLLESDTIEIAITIENGPYFKTAGLVNSISLGTTSNVYYRNCKSIVIESFIAGIILFAIFHGIFLFLSQKKELAPLFFALFSLTILSRLVFTGKLYTFAFPFLTPYWYYKIHFAATFLMIPFYFMFLYYSYRQYINRKFINIVMVLCSALFLLTTFSHPVHSLLFFSPLLVYQIFYGFCALYVVHLYSKMIYIKKSDIIFEFIGISVFLITAAFDIIVDRGSFSLPYIMPAGLSVFVLLHSCQLSKRHARSVESLNESLQRVNRLKDEFLAKTSHELRTPLHGIMGIAELLKQGAAGEINDTISDNLSLIISSSKRLSNIINDILDFSKLKNNELELHFGNINLKALADRILAVLMNINQGTNVALVNTISDDIPLVYADENRVEQIFYNLIGNALKFTNEGSITISAIQTDRFVEISVTDTGIGIDKNKLDTIFELYEQVNNNGQPTSGTGIGLTMSRQLVTMLGGKMGVESEVGKGSRFYFTLQQATTPTKPLQESDPLPIS